MDVGILDGKIKDLGDISDGKADKIIQMYRKILAPSLIDLHSHVYNLATSLGVDADGLLDRSGVKVFVDAGSSGAGNFAGFRKYVAERTKAKVYCFLNIGFGGIPYFGLTGGTQVGEIPDARVADTESAEKCIEKNLDVIVGIKVRLSANANAELGVAPLLAAKKVARKFGLPVMLHFGRPPPTLLELLPNLEAGDILTHCLNGSQNSVVEERVGSMLDVVAGARKRGVLFDVGHGAGSFSFEIAKRAIDLGFFPDTISTDIHSLCVQTPVYDLPTTMTKLFNLGMPLQDVINATTYNPAKAIVRSDKYGEIREDRNADLVLLDVVKQRTSLHDSYGNTLNVEEIIEPLIMFDAGNPVKIDYVPYGST